MAKIKAEQISVHIDEAPGRDDCCSKCGADALFYWKHPRLVGGNCLLCKATWLPGLKFSEPKEVELELRIEGR